MTNNKFGRKKSTIADVARLAGVSPTAVSGFLNKRPGVVADATAQRIEAAVDQLGYRPSSIARGLVTRRSATIGLILSEIETPLFLQAIETITSIARGVGYGLLLINARTLEDEVLAVDILLNKEVEGILLFSISEYRDNTHLLAAQALGIPMVMVNRSNLNLQSNKVDWDNTEGIASVVNYLYTEGHRRIAFLLGPLERRSSAERLEGYLKGLQECNLEKRDSYLKSGDYSKPPENWVQAIEELISFQERPTAIIASDDMVAAIVLKTLHANHLHVPRDVSVVGVDDQFFCEFLTPALTTVRLPVIEAGKLAVEMLLEHITNPALPYRHEVLPCVLVQRESTGPPSQTASSQ